MFALVNLAAVNEMTVIERVFQDIFYLVFAVRHATAGFYATPKQIVGYILKSALPQRI